jgi:hypothetical protein
MPIKDDYVLRRGDVVRLEAIIEFDPALDEDGRIMLRTLDGASLSAARTNLELVRCALQVGDPVRTKDGRYAGGTILALHGDFAWVDPGKYHGPHGPQPFVMPVKDLDRSPTDAQWEKIKAQRELQALRIVSDEGGDRG